MCVIVIWNSYITILVLHLVHPSLDSTGFFVVNSVCALVCVKCENCGVVNSVCALMCVKCEKCGVVNSVCALVCVKCEKCGVVNSVCALVCVKCEKCGIVNSVCALVYVKCEKCGIHISSSTGRLPYCHVHAEHVEETIISGGKLPQPDGCHPVL